MVLNFFRKRALALATAAGLVSTFGCAPVPQTGSSPAAGEAEDARPSVVAMHTVLCNLTEQIAGDTVDLQCLIPAGTDVHVYEPTPEASRAIESADLILYNGYGFESGLIGIIEATSNPAPKVAVGEEAVTNPLMGEDHHHHGEGEAHAHEHEAAAADEAHEHEHEEAVAAGEAHEHAEEETTQEEAASAEEVPDPHVWQNAENGARMAEIIRDRLTELQPEQSELYAQNTAALTAELAELHNWIRAQITTIPEASRKLVTTHDALGYYAAAYNIPVEGALLGISTEEAPTAARVKELVEEIEAAQVPTIFAESNTNPKLIETVAREANVELSDRELYADSLGEPGSAGDTYQKMLVVNTEAIVEELGGSVTLFQP